jgi:hypothetical protein
MQRTDYSNLQVGDELTRSLAGVIDMQVIVGYIDDEKFKVGSEDGTVTWQEGWTFNKKTGLEIDEDLGWDGIKTTGSYIKQ